jgi:hypothetical protein
MAAMRKPGIGGPLADPHRVPEGIIVGTMRQARSDRIQHDIAAHIQHALRPVKEAIVKPVLPHASRGSRVAVHRSCDGGLHAQHALRERCARTQLDQAVPMVGHQHPGEQRRIQPKSRVRQASARDACCTEIGESALAVERLSREKVDTACLARSADSQAVRLRRPAHGLDVKGRDRRPLSAIDSVERRKIASIERRRHRGHGPLPLPSRDLEGNAASRPPGRVKQPTTPCSDHH